MLTTAKGERRHGRVNDRSALLGPLRALADANRLRIIGLLRQGEACVCEMTAALGLPQNLVSHHLRVLREAGLLTARRDPSDARWVYYALDPRTLVAVRGALDELLNPGGIQTRIPLCDTSTGLDGQSPTKSAG